MIFGMCGAIPSIEFMTSFIHWYLVMNVIIPGICNEVKA